MIDDLEVAAGRLRDAADAGTPGDPVRDLVPDMTAAYAVQALNNGLALEAGRWLTGYKIGLTSEPARAFFGVTEPALGVLFEDMLVGSGDVIPAERLLQPGVEGEVAIVLGSDLDDGGYDAADVAAATDHVLPAIEIVDCRVAGYDLSIVDMIADNAGAGLYVLGGTPVSLAEVDLSSVEMSLSVGGEEKSVGVGADCFGNPLDAAAWLANRLVLAGTPLRAGAHIMTGALGPMVPMPAGQVVRADFGSFGSVTTTWSSGV